MAMRTIPSDYSLIPTTLEQATNPHKQCAHNKKVIAPGESFFQLDDYQQVHIDVTGNRVVKNISNNFLANGDYLVAVLPGVNSFSAFSNADEHLHQLIATLSKTKSNIGKLILISKDSPDELHDWIMQTLRKAPWYDAQKHNSPQALHELGIHAISDPSCKLINALGLATDSAVDPTIGIHGRKAMIILKNGVVQQLSQEIEHTAQETASNNLENTNGLIPTTILAAIENNKVAHNKKTHDTGQKLPLFKYQYLHHDKHGNKTIRTKSTNAWQQGKQCLITLPGACSVGDAKYNDPHLQDYIENIHSLKQNFDGLTIIAKSSAGRLYEQVKHAISQASWYDPKLHANADVLNKLGIMLVPDPAARIINSMGLACDGHKHGIVAKRSLMVAVNGTIVAIQYENDPLVSDRVHAGIAMQALNSLNLPRKKAQVLFSGHPDQKLAVIGGGIVSAMEVYFAYLEAKKNNKQIKVTVYEKNSRLDDTTAANISPSLTADEILSVVPRGKALAEALSIPFYEPGGISVMNDKINKSSVARNFIAQVELYRDYEEEHKNRTNALLQLGKFSMDLWQKIYDEADAELKQIFDNSNFKPCREPKQNNQTLNDGYRIDLIYNVTDARSRAENMKTDYVGIGYKHCKILTPAETVAMDPALKEFCERNSIESADGQRVWNNNATALYRPGGCLNARAFLPKFYAYLQKVMGQYVNEHGKVKNCFNIKYLHEVNGVVYGSGINEDANSVVALKINDEFNPAGITKYNKYSYNKVDYVFAPGARVGALTNFGFTEPEYAAFAGASLLLRIPIPEDQMEKFKNFDHCMEVHQVGVVLAWQARRIDKHIVIGVAGTKAFYGDQYPHKDEEFAVNRNLLQLNMINDVLPQCMSLALQRDTTGQKLTAEDMRKLEESSIAHRWAGNRGVIYDGVPIFGKLSKQDGTRLQNAGATAYLSSGGVSFAPGSVLFSRLARGMDPIFTVPTAESLRDMQKYTAADRKL